MKQKKQEHIMRKIEKVPLTREQAFFQAVLLFIFGSFAGCIWEVVLTFLKTGVLVSRKGLIYGPFSPVYGIGTLIYYYILKDRDDSFLKVFLLSFFLGGTCEFLCSYLQEMIFGTISWDYHHYFFNIGGRTSLFHSACWGIVGVILVKIVFPFLTSWTSVLLEKLRPSFTMMITLLMAFDILLSFFASYRQKERVEQIPPSNHFEEFLDRRYPNEVMDRIYENKKVVTK